MSETQKNKLSIQTINLWIYENFRALMITSGVVLFLLLAGGLFLEWQKKHEKEIYGQLYKMQKKLQSAGEKANGKNYRTKNKKGDSTSFVYSEDMQALANKYEETIKIYKGKTVGAVFAIDLADFFYFNNEKERAKSLLSFYAFPKKKSSVYHLASLQLANYFINEKNCDKALVFLEALIQNKKAHSFHKSSYFQSALCQEEAKNYTKAKELYKKVIESGDNEFNKNQFQEYLHLLTLKQKLENK